MSPHRLLQASFVGAEEVNTSATRPLTHPSCFDFSIIFRPLTHPVFVRPLILYQIDLLVVDDVERKLHDHLYHLFEVSIQPPILADRCVDAEMTSLSSVRVPTSRYVPHARAETRAHGYVKSWIHGHIILMSSYEEYVCTYAVHNLRTAIVSLESPS